MKFSNALRFLAAVLICQIAGILGSAFTAPEIRTWYKFLHKPWFTPPAWVFGPVWTILFLLMGISLYLVWIKKFTPKIKPKEAKQKFWNPLSKKLWVGEWSKFNAIAVFVTQLALNVLWSIIFFGFHNLGLAFFEIWMLWVAIAYSFIGFYRISKPAAYLLLPYLLWVAFAGVLNYYIWALNGF